MCVFLCVILWILFLLFLRTPHSRTTYSYSVHSKLENLSFVYSCGKKRTLVYGVKRGAILKHFHGLPSSSAVIRQMWRVPIKNAK